VPVPGYATCGTEGLGEHAVGAMADADASACLLANHGLVAVGDDVDDALETVVAVESVAQVYCQGTTVGTPEPLPESELDRVERKLAAYGAETDRSDS
jgi:L-fuculose-phosphate aldolase